jgi:hypothetical protein
VLGRLYLCVSRCWCGKGLTSGDGSFYCTTPPCSSLQLRIAVDLSHTGKITPQPKLTGT